MAGVRARFRCTKKDETYSQVTLEPDYSSDENKAWAKFTPSGKVEMRIDNPPALAVFEVGKDYFIDFTPAG